MDIKAYFAQEHTPGENSPVGLLVVKVLAKNPGVTFEQARQEANTLLDKAAAGRVYRTPRVFSTQEKAAHQTRLRAVFGQSRTAQVTA